MKLLALAVLVAALPAAAAPHRRPPPKHPQRPAACGTTGTPLFAIHHDADTGAKLPTSTTSLYESGGWTTESTDASGKALAPSKGCLTADQMASLKAELQGAPWKVTQHRFHCMAYSASYTVYELAGKQVYTARLCSPDSLDDQSEKAISDVEAAIGVKK